MANNDFNDWKTFAKGDWRELVGYVLRTHGSLAWTDVQKQFAKRMNVGSTALEVLTNYGTGKIASMASSPISTALDVSQLFSRAAGSVFIAGANTFYNRTRYNPHSLSKQAIFSSEWEYSNSQVPDYVDFMLYWYPKDRKEGYRGFRYGCNAAQGAPMLPKR